MGKWLYRIGIVIVIVGVCAAFLYEKLYAILVIACLIPSTLALLFAIYISARLLISEWKDNTWNDRVKNAICSIIGVSFGFVGLYFIFPFYISYGKYIFKKPSEKHKAPQTYYYDSEDEEHETYTTVYICTGPNSTKFHHDEYCKGLKNCSGEIEETLLEDAKMQGFEPCGYCYE